MGQSLEAYMCYGVALGESEMGDLMPGCDSDEIMKEYGKSKGVEMDFGFESDTKLGIKTVLHGFLCYGAEYAFVTRKTWSMDGNPTSINPEDMKVTPEEEVKISDLLNWMKAKAKDNGCDDFNPKTGWMIFASYG
jgi:hypothetical protein